MHVRTYYLQVTRHSFSFYLIIEGTGPQQSIISNMLLMEKNRWMIDIIRQDTKKFMVNARW